MYIPYQPEVSQPVAIRTDRYRVFDGVLAPISQAHHVADLGVGLTVCAVLPQSSAALGAVQYLGHYVRVPLETLHHVHTTLGMVDAAARCFALPSGLGVVA